MKKLLTVLSLICFGSSQTAYSDSVTVRTGEHESFTRIVVSLPKDAVWTFGETGDQVRLTINQHSDGFDLSNAFTRISRTRVSNIQQDRSALVITRNCDCTTNVFEEQNGLLVLDVTDEPRPEVTSNQGAIPVQNSVVVSDRITSAFDFGELLWPKAETFRETSQPDATQVDQTNEDAQTSSPLTNETYVAEALQSLSTQVGEATTRGILKPVSTTAPTGSNGTGVKTPDQTAQNLFDEPQIDTPSTNIRVSSSQDIPARRERSNLSQMGIICPLPEQFAVENWGGKEPFHRELGNARATLFNTLGAAQSAEFENLAKLYLHYGFGAEASKALSNISDSHSKLYHLHALAEIVDKGHMERPGAISGFTDCSTNVALWAILADTETDPTRNPNASAAVRAFEKLPTHLREAIGPILVLRLQSLGDLEHAGAVYRNLERLAVPNASVLTANVMSTEIGAADALSDVATSNSPVAPLALIRFVDENRTLKQKIPSDIALLIEAYSVELAASDLGSDMMRAHILASSSSDQFGKAFSALAASAAMFSSDQYRSILLEVVSELTSDASDADFLLNYFDHVLPSKEVLALEAAILAADRVFTLGFAAEAEELISSYEGAGSTEGGALILAKLALEKDDPFQAIRLLDGANTPEAERLLALAYNHAGLTEQAYFLLQDMGDQEGATLSAWLSDEWSELLPNQSEVFESALRVSNRRLVSMDGPEQLLTNSRTALQESQDTRVDLELLLTSVETPN